MKEQAKKNRLDFKSRPQVVLVNRAIVQNKEKELLIMKRAKKDSYMPDKWELPGGKLDIGQDVTDALEREVLEETGLVVIPVDKIAYWESKILTSGKYKGLLYIALIGIAKSLGGEVMLSEEHNEFAWVGVKDALKYDLIPETRAAISVLSEKLA